MNMYRRAFTILSVVTGLLIVLASCMKDKPESLPTELEWNPELAFPLGDDSFGLNAESGFDTTWFEIDSITNLPVWLDKFSVVLEGRIPINLTSFSDNIDDLNQVLFRINIYNGFPNEALMQSYFLDINQNPIDSMFSEGAIPVPPGRIMGKGETIDPSILRKDVVYEHERIVPLQNAVEVLLRATFLNPEVDTALMDYYRTYHIDVDVGMMVELTYDF